MPAILNSDGSVTLDNGCVLTAAQVAAAKAAKPRVSPLIIKTGKGRVYGNSGTPRYGVAMDPDTGKWHYLDENWEPIPGTSWKARNLSRCTFTFLKAR